MSGTDAARARAHEFVRAHGDRLQRLRADALVGGDAAPVLLALDDADLRRASVLRRVLHVCDELSALRSPLARRAFEALETGQQDDGGFAETGRPLEERLQQTGLLGGILARSPYGRPETLAAAGDFLARHFTPDLFQGFRRENIAAYARYFANAPHDAADEVLQWCGRELERGFRARAFDALDTARVLMGCDAHGLPGARLPREDLLLGLLAQQGLDGAFGAAEDREERVESTLQGLRALGFLGGSFAGARSGLDSRAGPR